MGGLKFKLKIRGDNNATTLISDSRAGVRKVRHLDLGALFVREQIAKGSIEVSWIGTDLNSSDCLTKVLGWVKAEIARQNLHLYKSDVQASFAYRGRCVERNYLEPLE